MKLSASAQVSIASNAVLWIAIALAWHGVPSSMLLSYEAHKLLHIVGVIIFAGNIIAGPVWLFVAFFSGDRAILAFAARALAAADIYLTMPGLQLAVWNGTALATVFGGVRAQPWLFEAVVLLAITSGVSLTIVLPVQERFVRLAQGDDIAAMKKTLYAWSVFGTLISLPLGLVLWDMIAKRPVFL
jgi:uncharacterized membrane protein